MNLILKRGLMAGLVNLLVGVGLNMFVQMLLPAIAGEYKNTGIFRSWTDPLMMLFFVYPFIVGVASAYLWEKLGKPEPAEFAKLYYIIATIPGMFITYTSFKISLAMVLLWTITGYIEALIAAYVFVRIKK